MELARTRAFALLKKEFGSSAHFWPRPKFSRVSLDFYWRRANLGVMVTGPLLTLPSGARKRDQGLDYHEFCSGELKRVQILKLPYYMDLAQSCQSFVGEIRAALAASGKYPKL